MPWAGPGYRSDLADECGRGQNSLRRRLEALGWSRLALPSPDDQSGTIAHQRAVVEIQGWSTQRIGRRTEPRGTPYRRPERRRPPYARHRHGLERRAINATRWPPAGFGAHRTRRPEKRRLPYPVRANKKPAPRSGFFVSPKAPDQTSFSSSGRTSNRSPTRP